MFLFRVFQLLKVGVCSFLEDLTSELPSTKVRETGTNYGMKDKKIENVAFNLLDHIAVFQVGLWRGSS